MADDDKKNGAGASPDDPWAAIDADASSSDGDAFEFPSFETIGGDPAAEPEMPASMASEPLAGPVDSEAEAPAFEALSLGAQDGVFSDDGSWSVEEPPLAVFPPAESGAEEGEAGITAASPDEAEADALAHLEDADEAVAFEGVGSPQPVDSTPFGDEDVVSAFGEEAGHDGDPSSDASEAGKSTIQIGTGHSGIVAFEDWSESGEVTATEPRPEAALEENPFGEASLDEVAFAGDAFAGDAFAADAEAQAEDLVTAGGPDAVAATAATLATKRAKPAVRVKRRSSGGGGVAAMLSVLLGGVLSIPIVIGLLFWVFKKDPFNIAPKIPTSLSFLLPSEFQMGARSRTLPGLGGASREAQVASRSLGDLVPDAAGDAGSGNAGEEAASPPADAVANADGEPATDESAEEPVENTAEGGLAAKGNGTDDDLFGGGSSKPASNPVPPLDTSSLDAAVTAADDATVRLLGADEQDAGYKLLLKNWYLKLAKVGEEAVSLEEKATASGQAFHPRSAAVEEIIGRIIADEKVSVQLGKLSKMWLKAQKRPTDGVLLPAVMGTSRRVGPWWVSKGRIGDAPDAPEVSIVSRSQPEASEGDPVVVLGLVFEPGVVWAATCGRFEPQPVQEESKPEPAASPAGGDLFPLE